MTGETLSAQLRSFNPQGLGAPLIVINWCWLIAAPGKRYRKTWSRPRVIV